jgi:hypothetical protein
VTDCIGLAVHLHHDNWQQHILTAHPEMGPYHEAVAAVLRDPELIIEDPRNPNDAHYYRLGLGQGRYTKQWLRVVVAHSTDGSSGAVKTAHFIRAVRPRGRSIWTRVQTP